MEKNKGGIIVEGADQMGKSTFVEKLKKEISKYANVKVKHFRKNETDSCEIKYYTDDIFNNDGPYIFDRNFISELVYGKIFRGSSKINELMKKKIEAIFESNNYFAVIITRLGYEWEDRKEEYDEKGNKEVIREFKKMPDKLNMPLIHIIDENPSSDENVRKVVDFWKKINELNE